MLDHVSYGVRDFTKSSAFYDATLHILGYGRIVTIDQPPYKGVGYGKDGKPSFWISIEESSSKEQIGNARGFHLAFVAPTPESIDRWHSKCLELGGTDNGTPGPRAEYHPGYYGGFIIDPNGWRIEAALHHYQAQK